LQKGCIIVVLTGLVTCLLLCSGINTGGFVQPKKDTIQPSPTPLWTPPHLVSSKTVSPQQIWKNGTGVPDNASVTLTVKGEGNCIQICSPFEFVITMDTSNPMANIHNGSTIID